MMPTSGTPSWANPRLGYTRSAASALVPGTAPPVLVDMDQYAAGRFRSVMMASPLAHTAKATHIFSSALFRVGSGMFARMPGQSSAHFNLVHTAGELMADIHSLMINEDQALQQQMFQSIADRLAAFQAYSDLLKGITGLNIPMGQLTTGITWRSNGGNNDRPLMPGLGACLKPVFDLLDDPTPVPTSLAAAGNTQPQTMGAVIRTAVMLATKIRPDVAYSGNVDAYASNFPAAQLLADLSAVTNCDSNAADAGSNFALWTATALSGLANLDPSLAQPAMTLSSALSSIASDIQAASQLVSEVSQLISDVETIIDIIATYGPIILAILAALA